MNRWNVKLSANVENPKIDAFIEEVVRVSRKHGLAIAHEDIGGAFEIVTLSESEIVWLQLAHDATGE